MDTPDQFVAMTVMLMLVSTSSATYVNITVYSPSGAVTQLFCNNIVNHIHQIKTIRVPSSSYNIDSITSSCYCTIYHPYNNTLMKDLTIQVFESVNGNWRTWATLTSTQWGYPDAPKFNVQPGPPTSINVHNNNNQYSTFHSQVDLILSNPAYIICSPNDYQLSTTTPLTLTIQSTTTITTTTTPYTTTQPSSPNTGATQNKTSTGNSTTVSMASEDNTTTYIIIGSVLGGVLFIVLVVLVLVLVIITVRRRKMTKSPDSEPEPHSSGDDMVLQPSHSRDLVNSGEQVKEADHTDQIQYSTPYENTKSLVYDNNVGPAKEPSVPYADIDIKLLAPKEKKDDENKQGNKGDKDQNGNVHLNYADLEFPQNRVEAEKVRENARDDTTYELSAAAKQPVDIGEMYAQHMKKRNRDSNDTPQSSNVSEMYTQPKKKTVSQSKNEDAVEYMNQVVVNDNAA